MYGSANGANWELLAVASNVPMRESKGSWAFDGRTVNSGEHTNSNTIAACVPQNAYPFLGNMAGAVSVAPGATLVCEGATVTFSKIALNVSGAGTIKNAAFAANGEISVANVSSEDVITFEGLFDGCDTAANVANWNIRENGTPSTRYRAYVRNGALRLVCKRLCISFR